MLKLAWELAWTFIRALFPKFKGKLTCVLKNDTRNLVKFCVSSHRSEKLHFDDPLLSKACKVLDEKVEKSYFSWHWGVMQNLKKNSWFQKWHEDFGEF